MAGSLANMGPSRLLHQRRVPNQMPLLVKSSITINGRRFATMIHEGASAEDLISKVARENGGGVARVYYPEFGTHEIVAVKIGDQMVVKGDPKRVLEGDFSDFEEADSVKAAAVKVSQSSKGGIHFFVGSDGIPMAAAENESILFPNAQELRVSSNINNLSLSVVDYNVDPNSIRDINRLYGKGARISLDAKREIEKSHGGVRSEKLMLPDTSVLILSRESGDIRTASEFASHFKAEGFAFKPEPPERFAVQDQVRRGLRLPTDLGVMHIPLDGSSSRVPYICVKVFDGRVTDAIKVTMHPPEESWSDGQELPQEAPAANGLVAPAVALRPAKSPRIETAAPQPKTDRLLSMFIQPRYGRARIRPAPLPDPQMPAFSIKHRPKPAEPAKPNKRGPSRSKPSETSRAPVAAVKQKPAESIRGRTAEKPPKPASRKKAAIKRRQTVKRMESGRKKPKKREKPKLPRSKKKKAKPPKAKEAVDKKRERRQSKGMPRKKPGKTGKPKAGRKKAIEKKTPRKPPKTKKKAVSKKKLLDKKKSRKKKIHSYYFNTIIGLIRPKRSGARSSGRRRRASRT